MSNPIHTIKHLPAHIYFLPKNNICYIISIYLFLPFISIMERFVPQALFSNQKMNPKSMYCDTLYSGAMYRIDFIDNINSFPMRCHHCELIEKDSVWYLKPTQTG